MCPRPKYRRRVAGPPGYVLFKPAGVPRSQLSEIVLEIDELEAIRLADKEGLYHEEAAKMMNVSRQTFGRIIATARNKIAEALIDGYALRIEGGAVEVALRRKFMCPACNYEWEVADDMISPGECPECESRTIESWPVPDYRFGRRRGGGRRHGGGRWGRGH